MKEAQAAGQNNKRRVWTYLGWAAGAFTARAVVDGNWWCAVAGFVAGTVAFCIADGAITYRRGKT